MAAGSMNRKRSRNQREFIYGRNPVRETLNGDRQIHRLWVRSGLEKNERILAVIADAQKQGAEVKRTDAQKLDSLSDGGNHQGIVLETGPYNYWSLDNLLVNAAERTILILDHVQDPQNLATLIRTSAAVGIAGLVIQSDRSVSVTPAVVRASSGLVEKIPVARVANTRHALEELKESGYWAVALEQSNDSADIFTADIPQPAALVVGAEGRGVSNTVLKACDVTVHIPIPGSAESLNAAVAGSIALYELFRRNQAGQRE
jgi:23S rRNA (guanosine2251-2'-O)-methyltransferase